MVRKNVGEIIEQHATYELECIDRMYLNGYIPTLQTGAAAAFFIQKQFNKPIASIKLLEPMKRDFINQIDKFVVHEEVDLIKFEKTNKGSILLRHMEFMLFCTNARPARIQYEGLTP